MKEKVSQRLLDMRISTARSRRSFNTLLEELETSIILSKAVSLDTPSYKIFKRNNKLFIRLYSPGMSRVRELGITFQKADLLGYLKYVDKCQDYADFEIYFRRY
jgi:hypothetical protein